MFVQSIFNDAVSGVDTGDIGHSLRFRGAQYLSRTITTDATSTYVMKVKRGKLGVVSPIIETSIRFNANDTLTAFGLTTTAVFRDPTSWILIHISNNGLYVNGQYLGAVTTSAITNGRIGYDGTNHFYGYMARFCVVGGSASAYTNFDYFNTEINEWVSKTQSQVKAVVDAGGTNSFMLDFDDPNFATYNVGKDFSSKGNHWTPNGFSLTAGTSYDWMLDVPGNSFATFNPLQPSLMNGGSATIADGNLKASDAGTSYGCYGVASMPMSSGKWYWETVLTTAGGGHASAGVVRTDTIASAATYAGYQYSATANKVSSTAPFGTSTGTAYGATYTAGDVIGHALDLDAGTYEFFKNGVSQGVAFTGITGQYAPAVGDAQNATQYVWNPLFGQAPLHASATYHSAAGGYFRYTPPTGYKALCQRNMPDPAILNPKNGFVSVLATEDNIYSALAAARSGWTDYVDILKNRAASESWAWQFSHDSSNEYAVAASSLVRQTKRTQSGSNNWVGYSIRIGATYGTAAGSVSHTNGAATTITHNIGKSARQLILLFNRAGGSAVPVCHPDLTSGELLDLCTTAADAASTAITSVGTNSFQIGSGVATGTYDYLVCSEISQFFDLGKWTGNAAADGAYYNADHKPKMLYAKSLSTTDDHRVYDDLRPGYNVQGGVVLANTNAAETTAAEMDITAFGVKARIATTPNAAQTYVTASWASVASKYSLAR